MAIDLKLVAQLREQTGLGLSDCKKALEEANGDLVKALEILRKRGEVKAAKKMAERTTKEGLIGAYIHGIGKVGALVNVACETDFVAKTDGFKELVKDIAMQVAAMAPQYINAEAVPAEVIEKEKEIYRAQLKEEGKPEQMWDKIIEGKLQRFYNEVCLLNQAFIKDETKKVSDLLTEAVAKTGEKIEVKEMSRFQV
ncbi:MAG: translation elongation factor Ts [bacterium]